METDGLERDRLQLWFLIRGWPFFLIAFLNEISSNFMIYTIEGVLAAAIACRKNQVFIAASLLTEWRAITLQWSILVEVAWVSTYWFLQVDVEVALPITAYNSCYQFWRITRRGVLIFMVSRGRRNFEIVSQRRKSSCLHFYYGGPSILRAIFRQLFEVKLGCV